MGAAALRYGSSCCAFAVLDVFPWGKHLVTLLTSSKAIENVILSLLSHITFPNWPTRRRIAEPLQDSLLNTGNSRGLFTFCVLSVALLSAPPEARVRMCPGELLDGRGSEPSAVGAHQRRTTGAKPQSVTMSTQWSIRFNMLILIFKK